MQKTLKLFIIFIVGLVLLCGCKEDGSASLTYKNISNKEYSLTFEIKCDKAPADNCFYINAKSGDLSKTVKYEVNDNGIYEMIVWENTKEIEFTIYYLKNEEKVNVYTGNYSLVIENKNPVTDPVDNPKDDPTTDPDPVDNPVDDPITDPDPVDNPVDDPITDPDPVDNPVDDPTTDPDPVDNPVDDPTTDPDPVDNPVDDPTTDPDPVDETLKNITFLFDTTAYTVSSEQTEYTIYIKKPLDYNNINVIIELNDGVILDENITFTVNGENVDSDKFAIDGNVIKYSVEDPNWTPFY